MLAAFAQIDPAHYVEVRFQDLAGEEGEMALQMSKAEREAVLAGLHVGVISIAEPGRGPLSGS
jgi:hypothetical protein